MHLCFWLFFFLLKTETTSNPIIWNRSFFFPSSTFALKEFSLLRRAYCGFQNQNSELITDLLWKLCVYRLLNQILVRTSSTSTVRNVHSDENLFFYCSTSLTKLSRLDSLTQLSFSIPLGPPSHETKNVHILIGVTHTRMNKKSLNLFVRIAGIMMMMKNSCFCYCSFVILLYATRFGYAIHKQNVCGNDWRNFTWWQRNLKKVNSLTIGNASWRKFLSAYLNHF